eukprot:170242-Chlamydomonas_euryale.AAC.20
MRGGRVGVLQCRRNHPTESNAALCELGHIRRCMCKFTPASVIYVNTNRQTPMQQGCAVHRQAGVEMQLCVPAFPDWFISG